MVLRCSANLLMVDYTHTHTHTHIHTHTLQHQPLMVCCLILIVLCRLWRSVGVNQRACSNVSRCAL